MAVLRFEKLALVLCAPLLLVAVVVPLAHSLAASSKSSNHNRNAIIGKHRRHVVQRIIGGAAAATAAPPPIMAQAASAVADEVKLNDSSDIAAAGDKQSKAAQATTTTSTIDMEALSKARASRGGFSSIKKSVIPIQDPPPLLSIGDGKGIKIPRVGYSLYKTPPDQAERCTRLALLAGVQHLDVATQYGCNAQVAKSLETYLNTGLSGLLKDASRDEKPELLQLLASTRLAGEPHARECGGGTALAPPPVDGSIGRRGRRQQLFIHYKLSNAQQSLDGADVKRAVKSAIATLGCTYLDMVSIHSPINNVSGDNAAASDARLTTYAVLLELRNAGIVKSVGVCNYGLGPLQQLEAAKLELPTMNQLEISPFSTHAPIVHWCHARGVAIGCSAWSRLSSTTELQDGWLDVVGGIANRRRVTKAQVLVRWALQKGYTCVPRSACATKIERMAIAQNSYGGVSHLVLSEEEMTMLDALNVNLKAGSLGRRDGWEDSDVNGPDWDPTDVV